MNERTKTEDIIKKPMPHDIETNAQNSDQPHSSPKEFGGKKGPEPTRYGDWENNGIASDF